MFKPTFIYKNTPSAKLWRKGFKKDFENYKKETLSWFTCLLAAVTVLAVGTPILTVLLSI